MADFWHKISTLSVVFLGIPDRKSLKVTKIMWDTKSKTFIDHFPSLTRELMEENAKYVKSSIGKGARLPLPDLAHWVQEN